MSSSFLAFLFADIRGYTAYTGTRGSAAAARLAGRFAQVAGAAVTNHAGVVVGRWGDEVLAEFSSAREAVAAALELQHDCRAWTVAHPDEPLATGVGLDVGEPVTAEEARASEALNLAARLCSAAAAGEVLASRELMHLAGLRGDVDARSRRLRLKGIQGRTEALSIRPIRPDYELEEAFRAVLRALPAAKRRCRRRRRRALAAALTVAALVLAGGAWWLARRPDRSSPATIPPQAVGAIDVNTWRLVDAPAVGAATDAIASVPKGRYVWAAEPANDAIVLIDAETHSRVQTLPDPNDPVALLVHGQFLWVVDGSNGNVDEYSTTTYRRIGSYPVGNDPSSIAYGFNALWVTNEGDGTLTRLSLSGGRRRTIDVGTSPDAVTAGDGGVWVANRADDTVTRVDPTTLQPGAPIRVGAGPAGILATPSGVWVANSLEATVTRINPRAPPDAAPAVITVGQIPTRISAGAAAIWVSDTGDGTIARIDPASGQVTRRGYVGISPHGIALTGGTLWVAGAPFASTTHRGGTLTIASLGGLGDSIDPAFEYSGRAQSVLHLVYDGLVGFNQAPGIAGARLVPDLAVRLPQPQDNGRTYTFVLRSGIRYSNGDRLRPEDIRRGVERVWTTRGSHNYLDGIIGASKCTSRRCDLSRGINTDDAARTVTFHLVRPDSDFIAKLAVLESAAAVPSGTPAHRVTTRSIPGTGPYRISTVTLQPLPSNPYATSVTLVRNRWFTPWSLAAQPPGYPDKIRVVSEPSNAAALSAFRHRTADVIYPTPQQIAGLSSTERNLLHTAPPPPATNYVALNPRLRPFSSPMARHAAAYALAGEPALAHLATGKPRCTWVPPHYPGYWPRCPYYPRNLETARRLVARSGTRDDIVNVYSANQASLVEQGRELVRVFRRVGYQARLRKVQGYYNTFDYNRRARPVNATTQGWGADYFAASQFYEPLLSCNAGGGMFGTCNRAIDALAANALRQQLSNPGAAQRTWQRVDRLILADARIIPFGSWTGAQTLMSDRTGNFTPAVYEGYGLPDLDQLWVK